MDTQKLAEKFKTLLIKLAIEDKLSGDMNELPLEVIIEALKEKPVESVEGVKYFVDVPPVNGQDEWHTVKEFDKKKQAIEFAKKTFGADDNGMVCLISES